MLHYAAIFRYLRLMRCHAVFADYLLRVIQLRCCREAIAATPRHLFADDYDIAAAMPLSIF